ncbi:hypothetical protein [Clostridium perfringens]|uniref:hypothetical protein n=1 Tax=Clostridium perfringens TaxID=1502 RepID=UPI003CEB0718
MFKSPKKAVKEYFLVSDVSITKRDFRIFKKKSNKCLKVQSMKVYINPLKKAEINSLCTRVTKRCHKSAEAMIKWNDNFFRNRS